MDVQQYVLYREAAAEVNSFNRCSQRVDGLYSVLVLYLTSHTQCQE